MLPTDDMARHRPMPDLRELALLSRGESANATAKSLLIAWVALFLFLADEMTESGIAL